MEVFQLNQHETRYLYGEIFEQREYVSSTVQLPARPVIVDVGANIGIFSLFALDEWQPSRLLAVEPIFELQQVLELNLGKFNEVQIAGVGAGRTQETAAFTYYPGFSIMSGRYPDRIKDLETVRSYARWEAASALSVAERAVFEQSLDKLLERRFSAVSRQADIWPLSQLLGEYGLDRVDLLKIDAQGSEVDVLEGIGDEQWSRIANIVVEVDERHAPLASALEIFTAHRMTCELRQLDAYRATGLHLIYARHQP
jgi:FkbM family methyltransferase